MEGVRGTNRSVVSQSNCTCILSLTFGSHARPRVVTDLLASQGCQRPDVKTDTIRERKMCEVEVDVVSCISDTLDRILHHSYIHLRYTTP